MCRGVVCARTLALWSFLKPSVIETGSKLFQYATHFDASGYFVTCREVVCARTLALWTFLRLGVIRTGLKFVQHASRFIAFAIRRLVGAMNASLTSIKETMWWTQLQPFLSNILSPVWT